MEEPFPAALQILVGVTVFTTGFLSIGIVAEWDRSISRAASIDDALHRGSQDVSDKGLALVAAEVRDTTAAWSRSVAWGNIAVAAVLAALTVGALRREGLRFEPAPSHWVLEFWVVLATVLIDAAVVALGFAEVRRMRTKRAEAESWSLVFKVSRINAALGRRRPSDCLSTADHLVEQLPDASFTWRLRARTYRMAGDLENAEKSILRVLEKLQRTGADPEADDYLEVVAFYEAKGEPETAVGYLGETIRLNPRPFEAQLRGARLLLQAELKDEAVSFLAPAVPETDAERADKARAYVEAGRADLAMIDLEDAPDGPLG